MVQRRRPIAEHVSEYRRHLESQGRSDKHRSETIRLINSVIEQCGFEGLDDLQGGGAAIADHLATRRDEGAGHRTLNGDLVAISSFCRRLIQQRRLPFDPTTGLARLNVEADRRYERRALADDEAKALILAASRSQRVFHGLHGRDRALLYTLAQRSGFRRKELVSLTPRSFDLGAVPSTVEIHASRAKNGKTDVLPLPNELAALLREYLVGRDPDQRLWPRSWWRRSAEMLRADLAEAGIAAVDAAGHVVDFHGQRTTFITALSVRRWQWMAMGPKRPRRRPASVSLG